MNKVILKGYIRDISNLYTTDEIWGALNVEGSPDPIAFTAPRDILPLFEALERGDLLELEGSIYCLASCRKDGSYDHYTKIVVTKLTRH